MKRKIFIAINLPDQTKKKVSKAIEAWRHFPMRWAAEEQYHLTLHFIGYINDEKAVEICEKTREIAERFDSLELEFHSIELAPDPTNPRMLWLKANASEELGRLREEIEKELGVFSKSPKCFRPHITLGRVKRMRWENLPEKPVLRKEFHVNVSVESIDVMASEFTKRGLEYFVVESCSLK